MIRIGFELSARSCPARSLPECYGLRGDFQCRRACVQVRRVTLRGEVHAFAEHDGARAADCAAYLAKFPDAQPITALADFAIFRFEITGGRLVSGFGGAINLSARALPSLLAVGTPVAGDFPTN